MLGVRDDRASADVYFGKLDLDAIGGEGSTVEWWLAKPLGASRVRRRAYSHWWTKTVAISVSDTALEPLLISVRLAGRSGMCFVGQYGPHDMRRKPLGHLLVSTRRSAEPSPGHCQSTFRTPTRSD
jgi:hypothetical protein